MKRRLLSLSAAILMALAAITSCSDNADVPVGLDADTQVLKQPIDNILVASTPVTSLINAVTALDSISLTTYDADSWYIDDVKNAILDGRLTYVGDYKAPDFEMITASGSTFSIYSTMLTNDVAAQLKQLGVYVMLDVSADEDHPLARVEWAKLYGAMFDCEEKAEAVYNAQASYVEEISKLDASGKSVAIFYITSKGKLYARNADDYMAKMAELAGGEYILSDVGVGEKGTINMEIEAFYDKAKDADYIIYIYSLGGKPETLDDFLARSEILSEMKAVKEGNVWCTTPDFFRLPESDCRAVRARNFLGREDVSGGRHHRAQRLVFQSAGFDNGARLLHRLDAVAAVCAGLFGQAQKYVHAAGDRHHDQLYLLGSHRFPHQFRQRIGYSQSDSLVAGELQRRGMG